MDGNHATRGGIGFFGMLGILLIGPKLAGLIDWPWWAVLLPIWAPWAVVLACLVIIGAITLLEDLKR